MPPKMHEDEFDTNEELVRRLVAAQFPDWASLDVTAVASSGTDNALFRLGSELVARLPRIPDSAAAPAGEARWLPQLAKLLPVEISEPLALGVPGEGFPCAWSILRWIDGANPVRGSLAEPSALARDLGEFVLAIRAIELPDSPLAYRSGSLADRDQETRESIAAAAHLIDAAAATAAWDQILTAPAWAGPDVWIHGDLSPGNVLVRNGRLVAVIDFAGSGLGDPAVDLLPAWNLLPPPAREDFRSAADADDAMWRRAQGWAMSIALIALPYYEHTNPALVANSPRVIAELSAELSNR